MCLSRVLLAFPGRGVSGNDNSPVSAVKFELRRWLFGGSVGFFVLLALLTQLALEWRHTHEVAAKRRRDLPVVAATPASKADPLGQALEALERTDVNDPIRLQRAQQRLIDEAKKWPPRYYDLFALRLETIERMAPPHALVLTEAFFATAKDEHWRSVGQFLARHGVEDESPTCVSLRGRFLERVRRSPPGQGAWVYLEEPLTQLVKRAGDLGVAHVAAEAYLVMHRPEGEAVVRERLRRVVSLRPASEHAVFADLISPEPPARK